MNHVSEIGFKQPKHKTLTPADKMNAVLPFSKRPACPWCDASMLVRTRRSDGQVFWACSTYSRCSGTRPIDQKKFKVAFDLLCAPAPQRPEITALSKYANEVLTKTQKVIRVSQSSRRSFRLPTQKDFD